MIYRDDIDIFVTAGGTSSRMGQDKGLVMIEGKPMLQHLTDMLQENNLSFTLIANKPIYHKFGFKLISDLAANKGPMGALHTAFHHTQKEYVLLLGCDTPFFPVEAIQRLISSVRGNAIVVTKTLTVINPLQAIYPATGKDKVLSCIEENKLRMQEFIVQSPHLFVVMDDLAERFPANFINLNEPNDIERWKAQLQPQLLG